MKNLAIIPKLRSGSKGLKDKNIKLLNGKPLISYTIEAINSKMSGTAHGFNRFNRVCRDC